MLFTSPWLTSIITGACSFWAALEIAISVSWLSILKAPTANFWTRAFAIVSRALVQFSLIC